MDETTSGVNDFRHPMGEKWVADRFEELMTAEWLLDTDADRMEACSTAGHELREVTDFGDEYRSHYCAVCDEILRGARLHPWSNR